MKRKSRRVIPRRRNVYAVVARRLGHRIKPSGKLYRRRAKHKTHETPATMAGVLICALAVVIGVGQAD